MSFLKKFLIAEDGQDMVEYGLVVAAAVAGGVVVFTAFQTQLSAAFVTLEAAITAAL